MRQAKSISAAHPA